MDKINKKNILCISIIIIAIIIIYYTCIKKEDYLDVNSNLNMIISNNENIQIEENVLKKDLDNINNKIVVHITGAIKKEGIYELNENSRIADAIEMAGGLNDNANINNINLAYVLQDGMKIYIPQKGENTNEVKDNTDMYIYNKNEEKTIKNENTIDSSQNVNNTKTDKININTATQKELETLPGIGESTALKIINYRKDNGKFNSIEDIKKVSGIGESKYSKIKSLIKI